MCQAIPLPVWILDLFRDDKWNRFDIKRNSCLSLSIGAIGTNYPRVARFVREPKVENGKKVDRENQTVLYLSHERRQPKNKY